MICLRHPTRPPVLAQYTLYISLMYLKKTSVINNVNTHHVFLWQSIEIESVVKTENDGLKEEVAAVSVCYTVS